MKRASLTETISAIRNTAWVVLLAVTACCAASITTIRTAVFPLSSVSMAPGDLAAIAEGLRKELSAKSMPTVDGGAAKKALESVNCVDPVTWNRESCVRAAAQEVSARLVLSGSTNVIGSLIEGDFWLYDVRAAKYIWRASYKQSGPVEEFYQKVVPLIANELPQEVADPAPRKSHVHLKDQHDHGSTPKSQVAAAEVTEIAEEDLDIGVSPGMTIGVSALFAMGRVVDDQSPYGFNAFALYPTSDKSHARLRLGLPMFHSDDLPLSGGKSPDVLISLDHEWCMRGAAIGVGVSYMYLSYHELEGVETNVAAHTDSVYRAVYAPGHAFDLSLTIRGGRPNAAFYGKFSWPLPFIFEDNDPDNFFFEGSAFGVFGGKYVKAGMGITGMYKRREADRIEHEDSTYEYVDRDRDILSTDDTYHEYSLRRSRQYSLLVPCLKIAGLIAQHVVVNLTLELGGTIIPRFPNASDQWKPSIGLDIVYSIGPLKGPNVMDGTF